MSTKVSSPSTPAAPTTTSSIEDWVKNYPAVYELQQKYAPLEAQNQIDLMNKYSLPYAQALKTAQDTLYPNETALTNQLTAKVSEGMNGQLPDWAKNSYLDTQKALLGENALSGSGVDYMSRGLNEQTKNWQDYYTNLGLSISGKQPVYTASPTQTTNYTSGFTPNSVMSSNNQNYGNYSNAYSSMYNTNATFATNLNKQYTDWAKMAAGGVSGAAASSRRYKKNIKLWA